MRLGAWLIVLGALLGLAVSLYNYFSPVSLLAPDTGVARTPGAGLVILSTAILLAFGLILMGRGRGRGLRAFILFASMLAILGTGFAAYLLNGIPLLILMGVCLFGWIMSLPPRHSTVAG
jgi:hypothetical protein